MLAALPTILLAQFFGLYFLVICAAMLTNKKYYQDTLVMLLQNPSVILLSATLTLILGVILIIFHSIWVLDWPLIITLLAWLTFIKGIYRLFFPNHTQLWIRLVRNDAFYSLNFMVLGLLGIWLLYKGFTV